MITNIIISLPYDIDQETQDNLIEYLVNYPLLQNSIIHIQDSESEDSEFDIDNGCPLADYCA